MKKWTKWLLPVLALCLATACTQQNETVPVSGIRLNKTHIQFQNPGDSETLTATVIPANASENTVDWSSSNPAVASVQDGVVTAVQYGAAVITAAAGGRSASCDVVVVEPEGPQQEEFRIVTPPASLSCDKQMLEVEVISTLEYEISSLPEWITNEGTESAGNNRKYHFFTVSANKGTESRSGVIVFCNASNNCVPYSVTQETFVPKLTVSAESLSFSYKASSIFLYISSNVDWTITSSEPWCEAYPTSGNGNAQVEVTAALNESEEPRSAQLVISSADGSLTSAVSVLQEGGVSAWDVDWSRPFHHRSLVMRFTATWCGYCPMMATALNSALEQAPDKLIPLNLHGGGSDLQFNQVNPLLSQYLIEGYPSGIVDGRQEVPNYNKTSDTAKKILSYMQETEDNYPVTSAIGVESALDGRTLDVDVALSLRYAGDYKVTVMVTESGIIGYQADYNEGSHSNYVHNDVARMSLTNVQGDAFTTTEDKSTEMRHYSVSVPTAYNTENLKVVVYIQRAYGSQKKIRSGDYGDYYVDNAVAVPVGEKRGADYAQ